MLDLNKAKPWLGALATTVLVACAPPPPRPPAPPVASAPPVSTVFQDKESYLAQHFTMSFLPKPVQDSVVQSGAAPLGFDRVRLTQKMTMEKNGADAPSNYTAVSLFENAGNGLVRSMSTLQGNGFDISTTFTLSYRGLYPLRSQTFETSATRWPSLAETKQVDHYDQNFAADRISYVYHTGFSGHPQMTNPQQLSCNAGKRYDAAALNATIGGQARELTCQWQNANGVVAETAVYAYLEKYGFVLPVSKQNSAGRIEVSVVEFKAE
jgi:hypothetical protein